MVTPGPPGVVLEPSRQWWLPCSPRHWCLPPPPGPPAVVFSPFRPSRMDVITRPSGSNVFNPRPPCSGGYPLGPSCSGGYNLSVFAGVLLVTPSVLQWRFTSADLQRWLPPRAVLKWRLQPVRFGGGTGGYPPAVWQRWLPPPRPCGSCGNPLAIRQGQVRLPPGRPHWWLPQAFRE